LDDDQPTDRVTGSAEGRCEGSPLFLAGESGTRNKKNSFGFFFFSIRAKKQTSIEFSNASVLSYSNIISPPPPSFFSFSISRRLRRSKVVVNDEDPLPSFPLLLIRNGICASWEKLFRRINACRPPPPTDLFLFLYEPFGVIN